MWIINAWTQIEWYIHVGDILPFLWLVGNINEPWACRVKSSWTIASLDTSWELWLENHEVWGRSGSEENPLMERQLADIIACSWWPQSRKHGVVHSGWQGRSTVYLVDVEHWTFNKHSHVVLLSLNQLVKIANQQMLVPLLPPSVQTLSNIEYLCYTIWQHSMSGLLTLHHESHLAVCSQDVRYPLPYTQPLAS